MHLLQAFTEPFSKSLWLLGQNLIKRKMSSQIIMLTLKNKLKLIIFLSDLEKGNGFFQELHFPTFKKKE